MWNFLTMYGVIWILEVLIIPQLMEVLDFLMNRIVIVFSASDFSINVVFE
jgi:hypothetical protein